VNARAQKCEIASNQLLYLTVYPAECSTGSKPHEDEYPDTKSPADLLKCAQDSNKVMKLMQVRVDGNDVSAKIIKESNSSPFNFVVPLDNAFDFKPLLLEEIIHQWLKIIIYSSNLCQLDITRRLLQANQPVEHDVANWDINVVS